jgi:Ogr/Delta-like zinc finger
MNEIDENCPHCGKKMSMWMPSPESSWGNDMQLVCFNDDCPYYKQGWEWMLSHFNQKVSYRHRYNPRTGEKGPLPVFSPTALRSGIIDPQEQ